MKRKYHLLTGVDSICYKIRLMVDILAALTIAKQLHGGVGQPLGSSFQSTTLEWALVLRPPLRCRSRSELAVTPTPASTTMNHLLSSLVATPAGLRHKSQHTIELEHEVSRSPFR